MDNSQTTNSAKLLSSTQTNTAETVETDTLQINIGTMESIILKD